MKRHTPGPLGPLALTLAIAGPLGAGTLAPLSAEGLAALRSKEPGRAAQAVAQLQTLRASQGLDGRSGFTLNSTQTDPFGGTHVRVQQHYQGLPVWGGQLVLHVDDLGRDLEPTDRLYREIQLETTPAVSASEALAVAHAALAPKGSYAQPPTVSLVIYPLQEATLRPGSEGQINAQDLQPGLVRYLLTYHIHLELSNPLDPLTHRDFLVDASNGALIKQWNSLETQAAVGAGNSQYNGIVPLDTHRLANGSYELRDLTRGQLPHPRTGELGNTVRDMNHRSDMGVKGPIYTDADDTWGDGANYIEGANEQGTASPNGQTAAVDAAFGLQKTWDYFLKVHGRNGIDGVGTSVELNMHFGNQFDNAFWENSCFCMTFGDGDFFNTMTALDLLGHEMTHGVTATTAALNYVGESGGLNEANSDIHGTLMEFYARGGAGPLIGNTGGNWTIGEQLSAQPLRYLYRPDLDGFSSNYWYPNLGDLEVHYSSGPMNRAFYFLSQGATVTGDTSTQINRPRPGIANANFLPQGMVGVGNEVAAAIWFRAVTVYMTATTDYLGARRAAERAAVDLYGADGPELAAVQNAFAGINVGLAAGAPLDTVAPVVTASCAGGPSGTLTFTAIATDNLAVTQVAFFVDGLYRGTGTLAGGSYSLSIDAGALVTGAHTLEARAFDGAGNMGRSDGVFFSSTSTSYQPLLNGDFEQLMSGWIGNRMRLSSTAQGGSCALQLGGDTPYLLSQCGQGGLLIPRGSTSLTIGFDIRVQTRNPSASNGSPFVVTLSDSPATAVDLYGMVAVLYPTDIPVDTWVHKSYRLDHTHADSFDGLASAGKPVSLFLNALVLNDPTYWFIDNVTFDVAQPGPDAVPPVVGVPTVTRAGAEYTVAVTADDNVALDRVDFYLDGTQVGRSSRWPYTATLDSARLGNGTHKLEAWAFDLAGNVTRSPVVSFTQMDPVPDDTQFEQERNDTLATANVLLPGMHRLQGTLPNSGDVDCFRFTLQPGETLGLALTGPEPSDLDLCLLSAQGGQVAVSGGPTSTENLTYTNLTAGPIQVYARLTCAGTPSSLPYFLVPTFYLAPRVTASLDGVGPEMILKASATSAGAQITQVEFFVDAVLVGTVAAPPYALNFNASLLRDGVHAFTATAHDLAGQSSSSDPVTFTTPWAPVAPIQAAATLTRDATGQVASTVTQPGASYLWSIAGGTLTSGASGPAITFSAGSGDSLTLGLTVTSPAGQVAQSSKVIALVPENFDLDADAVVDPLDMAVFVPALGTRRGDPGYNLRADLNGDGAVDEADIRIFLAGLN